MKTDKILEEKLKKIYNNDEFVVCIFAMIKEKWKREKMLSFITMADSLGDKVTYEDIVRLGLLLKKKKKIEYE